MNQFLQNCLVNLTAKSSLDNVTIEDLEQVTNDQPYFAIGHLLLAKKLKLGRSDQFLNQAQKTALYIPNTFWLDYLLEDASKFESVFAADKPLVVASPEVVKAPDMTAAPALAAGPIEIEPFLVPQPQDKVVLTDGDDNVDTNQLLQGFTLLKSTAATIQQNEKPDILNAEPEIEHLNTIHPNQKEAGNELTEINQAVVDFVSAPPTDINPSALPFEQPVEEVEELVEEESAQPVTKHFTKEELDASKRLAAKTLAEVGSDADSEKIFFLPEAEHETLNGTSADTAVPKGEVIEEPEVLTEETVALIIEKLPAAEEIPLEVPGDVQPVNQTVSLEPVIAEPAEPKETLSTTDNTEVPAPTVDLKHEKFEEDVDPMPFIDESEYESHLPDNFTNDQMLKNIKAILDNPHQDMKTVLVPIDPYHTVDYFASQGIKLVLESEPTDTLGKNLRSFTQWLKHMKKVGPEDAAEIENESMAEATVIKIADLSNVQKEVVTEAMAQVLEKQGKTEKAVQLYIKLSFLYPDKSAYFANRIKFLKGIR